MKFASKNFLDNGLRYLTLNANILFLVESYTLSDLYSDLENNELAHLLLNADDFSIGDGAGASRVVTTTPGRTVQLLEPGTSGGVDMHFAFCNSETQEIIWVTDESSDALIEYGSILTFPALTYTSAQPV